MLCTIIGSDHNVVTVAEKPTAQQFAAAKNAQRSASRTRCGAVESSLRKGDGRQGCRSAGARTRGSAAHGAATCRHYGSISTRAVCGSGAVVHARVATLRRPHARRRCDTARAMEYLWHAQRTPSYADGLARHLIAQGYKQCSADLNVNTKPAQKVSSKGYRTLEKPPRLGAQTLYIDGLDISPRHPDEPVLHAVQERRELTIGDLRYLVDSTRADLAYVTAVLACTASAPTLNHWRHLQQVARYLRSTCHYGLAYRPRSPVLRGKSDADFAGCLRSRRLTIGRLIYLRDFLVSWKSKRIPSVVNSTCAAEYIAASRASERIMWLRTLLTQMCEQP
eukprot:IDg8291t1